MSGLSTAGLPGDADAGSMLAALNGRSHHIVQGLLSENESRWQSLSAADRQRAESLLLTVASRLLDRPGARIEPAQVQLLRELFALPAGADEMP